MGVWAYGRMGVWAYGRMGVWAYGRIGVSAYGRIGVWAYRRAARAHRDRPPDLAPSSETPDVAPSFKTPEGYVGQAGRLRRAGCPRGCWMMWLRKRGQVLRVFVP
jgi:hypothetical protein